jgi:hypothetical protein
VPARGETHQGEWNEDGTPFIGTDEDPAPFRLMFRVDGVRRQRDTAEESF